MALAATAIVHPANNIFKVALVGKADLGIVLKFALPAVSATMLGALLLNYMAAAQPIAAYVLGGRTCSITAMTLVIAFLIMVFAIFEIHPQL
jgi:hypothetical protein